MQIVVESPGARVDAELGAGEVLVLGREPEASSEQARPVVVASPSVSANHARVWLDSAAVCVRDLGSRNGTWLRVPSQSTARLETRGPISLQLALASSSSVAEAGPSDPEWSTAADYPGALVRALNRWLVAIGIAGEATVTPARSQDEGVDPARVPLPTGHDLQFVLRDTVDEGWEGLLERVWRWVTRHNAIFEAEEGTREEGLILASPAIRRAHRQIVEAAARGVRHVLILGPSGAGKEGLAQTFHRNSGRGGAFVALNCSLFNKELLRSELFGAEEGSFTGAVKRIVGAVERAHGGTLFLDEIGDLSAESQAMLLRFLDRGEYQRLGAYGQSRTADVRIVCATNRDLRAASQRGEFRADVWYRLSVVVVDVPPLRERPEDIVAYLQTQRLGTGSAWDALSPAARELTLAHSWDGNFRELRNFLERLPTAAPGGIDEAHCGRALAQGSLARGAANPVTTAGLTRERWSEITLRAIDAFTADHAGTLPGRWDDVKEYVEKYLKPLLFVQLAGIEPTTARDQIDVQQVARRVDADRGTAIKQIARYFECYLHSG